LFARAYVLLLVPILLGQGPASVVHEPAAPAEPDDTLVKDPARQDEGFLLGELHYSILTDLSERSTLAPAFGYALKGGYRWAIFARLSSYSFLERASLTFHKAHCSRRN